MANNDKRRLPVVQAAPDGDEEPRPGWHWVVFGAVAIFVVWLPLAWLAEVVSHRLVTGKLGRGEADLASLPRHDRIEVLAMLAAPQLVALLLAGMAGGFLVTRFGPRTRRRDAAYAGLAVGLVALGLTYAQGGVSIAPLVVPCLAAASGALGGQLGTKKL